MSRRHKSFDLRTFLVCWAFLASVLFAGIWKLTVSPLLAFSGNTVAVAGKITAMHSNDHNILDYEYTNGGRLYRTSGIGPVTSENLEGTTITVYCLANNPSVSRLAEPQRQTRNSIVEAAFIGAFCGAFLAFAMHKQVLKLFANRA